jgi:hypothetical protein
MPKIMVPPEMQGDPWRRMPKPSERLYGLSRTTLFELSQAGLIRTVHIRKPGAMRGIRLIFLPSLAAYLDGLANDSKQPKKKLVRPPDPSV